MIGVAVGWAIFTLGACAPTESDTGEAPDPAADGSIVLTDANNYAFSGTLDGPSFAVAERADVTLDWSALTTDLQCHALDPVADVDNVALLNFPYLTEAEVEAGLSTDTLEQSDLRVYLSYEPGEATTASLSQVSFFGTDPEIESQFAEGSGTWMMLLTTGTEIAIGARMLAFLTPTAGVTETVAAVDDGCSVLDFTADLTSMAPVPVLREGPWRLDWSALTRDGQGAPFEPTRADTLMVARFDTDLPTLEASFLDLEQLAAQTWTYTLLGGTSADLGALEGPSAPFPGFTQDGLWLVALRCSRCPNPAPLFLTVVEPA